MGNISSFESDDSSSDLSIDLNVNLINSVWLRQFNNIHVMVRDHNSSEQQMPAIRKKPDLRAFRHTSMYKEIKALCGLPPNSNRPSDKWSLVRAMQRRENGIAGYPSGAFTPNQHRRIINHFVPNHKEKRLMSLEDKIYVCKLNKDGSRLITACKDSVIRVYDATKGTYHLINRMTAMSCNHSILDVDFSPCGKYFAYCAWAENIYLGQIDGGIEDVQWLACSPNNRFHPGAACIFSVRFSPCGNDIIAGSNDSTVFVNDRTRNTTTHCIRINADDELDVNAVSYVSDIDPNLIVSGCDKGIIKLWDLRCCRNNSRNTLAVSSSRARQTANSHVGVFCGHFDSITYIDPRNDGRYILSNSKDQSIKIWDMRLMTPTDKIEKSLPVHYWNYQWSKVPRDYYNPSSSLAGDVSVMTYRGHRVTQSLLRAKFSPLEQTGQRYIYTGCSTGRIIIYDVLTGQIKEAIEGHKHIVRDLSWHPHRSEIISSSWDTHANLITYKYKPVPKRNEHKRFAPVRRSRRIAKREGQLDEIEDHELNSF